MRTAGNDADSINEYGPRSSSEGSENHFFRQSGSEATDYISGIERRLKALWWEFVEYQDKHGFDEKANVLKENYFSLYQKYRRNKNWKQIVSNNQ